MKVGGNGYSGRTGQGRSIAMKVKGKSQ